MAGERVIVRGDSYGVRRPLWTFTLTDKNSLALNLAGCTVRTTYKPAVTTPADDPTDATAFITHTLVIDGAGNATTSQGLYLVGAASAGTIEERLTATETRGLPLGVALHSDIEVTDAAGEVFSFIFEDTISARDGVTHRTT